MISCKRFSCNGSNQNKMHIPPQSQEQKEIE